MFAARTDWSRTPNRLSRLAERHRAAGLPILDLTDTNPTRCGFDYPEPEILSALSRREALSYQPDPRGLLSAREAIVRDYRARGITLAEDGLVLTSSTSEAYGLLFRLLAEPGDTVLVPSPSYPLFELLGRIHDVRLRPYALSPEEGFAIQRHALAEAMSEGTLVRALLLVSPGNPTGQFLKRRELETIVDLCAPRSIPLICDEVFGDYAFGPDPGRIASLAGFEGLLTFVLNGLSKMLALPQVKLGWIAASGPRDVAGGALERLEVMADTFLSVNTMVQIGLADLLELRPTIQTQVMRRILTNRDNLARLIDSSHPCRLLPAEGGWQAILEVPRTRTDEQWAIDLLEAEGVLTQPGYLFDFAVEGRLVVSLLPRPEVFAEGAERVLRHVRAGA